MRSRIIAILAAFFIAAGLFSPAPAQASPYQGCPDQSICLYQAKNYQQNRWTSSLNNVFQHTNQCLNIPNAAWANGTPVSDNSASLVVNNSVVDSPWIFYNIYVHQWANCNSGGGYRLFQTGTVGLYDLTQYTYSGISGPQTLGMYHNITSIELIPRASVKSVEHR